MKLFDNRNTYWVIKDEGGNYWSTRDQDWMGFTRATIYDDKMKAERVINSATFLLKNDMDIHNPRVVIIKVEEE